MARLGRLISAFVVRVCYNGHFLMARLGLSVLLVYEFAMMVSFLWQAWAGLSRPLLYANAMPLLYANAIRTLYYGITWQTDLGVCCTHTLFNGITWQADPGLCFLHMRYRTLSYGRPEQDYLGDNGHFPSSQQGRLIWTFYVRICNSGQFVMAHLCRPIWAFVIRI